MDREDSGKTISFKELCDARKYEMESVLPGFYSEVTVDDKSKRIFSPNCPKGGFKKS